MFDFSVEGFRVAFGMAYRSKGSRAATFLCVGAGNFVLVMFTSSMRRCLLFRTE
jgi:hypothetical protein